jgi:branched-chain amino acid transport system substrate-binding protein
MNLRRVFITAAALAAVVGLTPCRAAGDTTDPIKIGVPVSLSGTYAVSGKGLRDTFNMWADWVNAKGGLQVGNVKRKVNLIFADDRSDPNTAQQLTKNFIDND